MLKYKKQFTNQDRSEYDIICIYQDGTERKVSPNQDVLKKWLEDGNSIEESKISFYKQWNDTEKTSYIIMKQWEVNQASAIAEDNQEYLDWVILMTPPEGLLDINNNPITFKITEKDFVPFPENEYQIKINTICRERLIAIGYTDGLISILVWNMMDELKKKTEDQNYTINQDILNEYNQLKYVQEQVKTAVYSEFPRS